MKAIATIMLFLYHSQTMKQKLLPKLVTHAFCLIKKLPEGCLMSGMNKLTLIGSPNRHIKDFDTVRISFNRDDCCGCLIERASKMRQSPLVNHL